MDKNLYFSAFKYAGHRDENELRLDQAKSSEGEFDGSVLEMFNPIRADEVFQIEISADLDAMKVVEYLAFDGAGLADVSIIENSLLPADWNSDWEFGSIRGTISRYAVLIQEGKTWLIVGHELSEGIKLSLVDADDHDFASSRYKCRRILGELYFHSEGPGPVSWDGSSALLEMDGYWIYANGGDVSDGDFAFEFDSGQFALEYLDWLEENFSLVAFILEHVKCEWTSSEDSQRYAELFEYSSELLAFTDELNEGEVEMVLSAIQASKSRNKELIQILRAPSHSLAQNLMDIMDEVVESESARGLMWGSGFVQHLEKYSTK